MAKQKQNITPSVQKHYKGLKMDTHPIDQPEGTYRYALNSVAETRTGDMLSIANEESNEEYFNFTIQSEDGTKFVSIITLGSIYIDDNEHVIFGTTFDEDYSVIGVLNENGEVNIEYHDDGNTCLNFKHTKQINGTYRLRNGCEKTVYWVDGINPPRTINISDLKDTTPTCDSMDLIKNFDDIPKIEFMGIIPGGNLESGTYNIAVQLVDENNNNTHWILASQTVPVIAQPLTGDYDSVVGSSNKDSHQSMGDTASLFGTSRAAKSLKFNITNIDAAYKFYRVAVIVANSSTGIPSKAYASHIISYDVEEFVFDGNLGNFTEIAIEEVLLGPSLISSADHVEQVENRLLLANVRGPKHDLCSLQSFASQIRTRYTTKVVNAKDYTVSGNAKTPDTMWDSMSMMSSEAYALGIVYIFDDLSESPALHIPGRTATATDRELLDTNDAGVEWNDIQPFTNLDEATYNALPDDSNDRIERWKVYDTSEAWNINAYDTPKEMQFWEMQVNEYLDRYQDTCKAGEKYWGNDWQGNAIQGKIRHHKYPSRNTVPLATSGAPIPFQELYLDVNITAGVPADRRDEWEFQISYQATIDGTVTNYTVTKRMNGVQIEQIISSGQPFEMYVVQTSGTFTGTPSYAVTYKPFSGSGNDPITMNGTFRTEDTTQLDGKGSLALIGTHFDNVILPPGVKGYYFVRGDRDQFNRTVAAKGYSGHMRKDGAFVAFNSFIDPHDGNGWEKFNYSQRDKWILSPENVFLHRDIEPGYIKTEGTFEQVTGWGSNINTTGITQGVDDNKTGWADNDGFDWLGMNSRSDFTFSRAQVSESNRKVIQNNYLSPFDKKVNYTEADNGDSRTLYNTSVDNRLQFTALSEPYEVGAPTNPTNGDCPAHKRVYYISQINTVDVHPVLDNIKYYKMHTNPFYATDAQDIFGGDTFISKWAITSSSYQGFTKGTDIIEFVVSAIAILASVVVSVVTLGTAAVVTALMIATAVAAMAAATANLVILAVQTFMRDYEDSSLKDVNEHIKRRHSENESKKDETFLNASDVLDQLYMESDINIAYREQPNQGIPGFIINTTTAGVNDYMRSKFLYKDSQNGKTRLLPIPAVEMYIYNRDFSRLNKEKVYFALPLIYDCCSDCIEDFPNRIHYSEKSFIEEVGDSYGHFLPLNYIDIPSEHGEITNIFTRSNVLYAHTKKALWFIAQNVEERVTNDLVSLVGTGGFFAFPPRKIKDDTVGAAGSTQRFATLKTKYGVFFVDDADSVPYLLEYSSQTGTQLQPLDEGMSSWFSENLPLKFAEQFFKITGQRFPNTANPAGVNGIGMLSAVDYRYNRLLLTKRDYQILPESESKLMIVNDSKWTHGGVIGKCVPDPTLFEIGDPVSEPTSTVYDGRLVFNNYDGNFYTTYCIGQIQHASMITLDDPTFFRDDSRTISYSFSSGGWTSFHSYLPRLYIYDLNNLYSSGPGLGAIRYKLWKHNIPGNYNKFYTIAYPHILEYVVVNGVETDLYNDLTLHTAAIKNDTDQRLVTWNKAIFTNSRQCSGEVELKVLEETLGTDYMLQSITNRTLSTTIKRRDRNWYINGLRDMRTDFEQPIWLYDWDSIKNQFPIDKVINTAALNGGKDWMEREPFRDKYLIVRLIFDGKNDIKLVTTHTTATEQSVKM